MYGASLAGSAVLSLAWWAPYRTDPAHPEQDCLADPPANVRNERLWGFVGAPEVSTTDIVKSVNKKTGELRWRKVNNCDPS
jgi:hypothetical protein